MILLCNWPVLMNSPDDRQTSLLVCQSLRSAVWLRVPMPPRSTAERIGVHRRIVV